MPRSTKQANLEAVAEEQASRISAQLDEMTKNNERIAELIEELAGLISQKRQVKKNESPEVPIPRH